MTDHENQPAQPPPLLQLKPVGEQDRPGRDGFVYSVLLFAVVDAEGRELLVPDTDQPALVTSVLVRIGRSQQLLVPTSAVAGRA